MNKAEIDKLKTIAADHSALYTKLESVMAELAEIKGNMARKSIEIDSTKVEESAHQILLAAESVESIIAALRADKSPDIIGKALASIEKKIKTPPDMRGTDDAITDLAPVLREIEAIKAATDASQSMGEMSVDVIGDKLAELGNRINGLSGHNESVIAQLKALSLSIGGLQDQHRADVKGVAGVEVRIFTVLADMSKSIKDIKIPTLPKPEKVDLSKMEEMLGSINESITFLSSISSDVSRSVKSIKIPAQEPLEIPEVDMSSVKQLSKDIQALKQGIFDSLNGLESKINVLSVPKTESIDLSVTVPRGSVEVTETPVGSAIPEENLPLLEEIFNIENFAQGESVHMRFEVMEPTAVYEFHLCEKDLSTVIKTFPLYAGPPKVRELNIGPADTKDLPAKRYAYELWRYGENDRADRLHDGFFNVRLGGKKDA